MSMSNATITDPRVSIAYHTALVVASAIGVGANVFVLFALTRVQSRNYHYYFLGLSSASDLIVSGFIIPSIVFWDKQIEARDGLLCKAFGFLTLSVMSTEMMVITLVAVNRHALVTWPSFRYNRIFTAFRVKVTLVVIPVIGLLFANAPILGFGTYGYTQTMGMCLLTPEDSNNRLIFILGDFGLVLPATMFILIIYTRLAFHLLRQKPLSRSRTRMRRGDGTATKVVSGRRTKNVFILFLMWLIFVSTWFVAVGFTIFSFENINVPLFLHRFTSAFALANSATNPVVFILSDTKLRQTIYMK